MKYFRIRQDKRYLHPPHITNLEDIVKRRKDVTLQNALKTKEVTVAFSNVKSQIDFMDVLDSQLFMVSHRIREVFTMYEPALIFKEVCIINNCTDEYGRYFLPLLTELDCLSETCVVSPDRSYIKHIKLKHINKAPSIFKVAGLMTDIVAVRLDVVESLLRRDIRKLVIEPLDMEGA